MADDTVHAESLLDLQSPNFNPTRALYSKDVIVPCPNARGFQDVVEYEEFVIKKRKEKYEQEKRKKSSASVSTNADDNENATETPTTVPNISVSTLPTSDNAKKDSRHTSTIFSRIKLMHNTGPLSLLKKCMDENVVVKVIVRSAHGVRGYCRGYIVAFDNHFNLAMRDVDEVYKNPLWTSRSARRRFHKHVINEKKLQETRRSRTLSTGTSPPTDEGTSAPTDEGTSAPTDEGTSAPTDEGTSAPTDEGTSAPTDEGTSAPTDEGTSAPTDAATSAPTDAATVWMNDDTGEAHRDDGNGTSEGSSLMWMDVEPTDAQTHHRVVEKMTFVHQYKTISRHLNQVLIKGDNVVVVIAGVV